MKNRLVNFFLVTILCLTAQSVVSQKADKKVSQSPMTISELLINSTVKIESLGDSVVNGKRETFLSTSTAFFYTFQINNLSIPVLITNFHSIKNTAITKIIFTLSDSLKKPIRGEGLEYVNNNYQNIWIASSKNDLAILPIVPITLNIWNEQHKGIFYASYSEGDIPSENTIKELSAIEGLLMIGYPKGYRDSYNNYPIVRKGTTATPLYSNFDNKKEFLLDIPIYSGSSGSPVVLLNEGSFSDNKGGLVAGNRVFFVGIAAQSIDYRTLLGKNNLELDNPLNIAVVIKSSQILEFKSILTDLIVKAGQQLKNQKK